MGVILTPRDIEPGYYLDIDNRVIRVAATKTGDRVHAQRMVLVDGRIGWVYQHGLGVDLIITPLTAREVSRRVREAVAA